MVSQSRERTCRATNEATTGPCTSGQIKMQSTTIATIRAAVSAKVRAWVPGCCCRLPRLDEPLSAVRAPHYSGKGILCYSPNLGEGRRSRKLDNLVAQRTYIPLTQE